MRRITDTADRAMQNGNPYADVRIRPDWRQLLCDELFRTPEIQNPP